MHEVLRRNAGYKVASLILAILAWLLVTNQSSDRILNGDQMTVPLVIRNQPFNSIVMTKLPSVRVRLRGNNPSFNVKDLFAYVDLSGAATGEETYTVNMDAPPGIQVQDLQPNKITLQLDTVQEKEIPVQAMITGDPAEGFVLGNPVLKPSVVNVRGPSTVLATLDKVLVEVNVAGAAEPLHVSHPVLFRDKGGKPIYGPDPGVEILTASPGIIDVIVPVQPKSFANKMIPLRVTSKGAPAAGVVLRSLVPVPVSVQVFGTPDALKGFDSLALGPVDITGISEDKVFQIGTDKVVLPAGVSFAAGTNITVLAQIGPGVQEKSVSGIKIQVRNVDAALEVEQALQSVSVTVKGLPEDLAKLTPEQIQLWVDATGLAAGSYPDTQVYWQLPPGIEMVPVPNVTLSLKAKQ
ncbi:MAG: CdaR family protein [Desulfitobacteriaceae bacterium]